MHKFWQCQQISLKLLCVLTVLNIKDKSSPQQEGHVGRVEDNDFFLTKLMSKCNIIFAKIAGILPIA